MEPKRLFLLDAYALIFRAYYALIKVPRLTRDGFNTSAIFGFVNTLEELLRKERPTHMAVCFDPAGPTFRHEAFEQYKAERSETPEDIRRSIPIIKDIIAAYGIPLVEVPGFEADDVIGTLATAAAPMGFTTYMMTPDKDFGQLVAPNVLQYKPSYRGQDFEIRGVEEVCNRYGIPSPLRVIDLLALMGDKIDNIPGCPGVGEKTAVKLIADFGSIDNLLASTDRLKGALRKKIEDNAEQIRFSRFLATIRTDAPVGVSPDDLRLGTTDRRRLFEIFDSLEFKSLAQRVGRRLDAEAGNAVAKQPHQPSLFDFAAEPANSQPVAPPARMEGEYTLADSPEALDEIGRKLAATDAVGVWIVASPGSDFTASLIGAAVAWASGHAAYIPASPEALPFILDLLARRDVCKVSPDIKRDYVIASRLRTDGADAIENYFDITIAHYLLQPEGRHNIEDLASAYLSLKIPADPFAALPKKNAPLPPAAEIMPWATAAADATLRLRHPLTEEVDSLGMHALLFDVELPLAKVLGDMELEGVPIDVAALREAADTLGARLAEIEAEVYELAGTEFNIGSPAKVGEILFDRLGLEPKPKKTKSGQYSTAEDVLEKVVAKHPIVARILDHRRLKKLINTYLTALPEAIDPATHRIHTTYNQTVTATGRISSTNPNLQNIPVRDDVGRDVRRAFIAPEGMLFMSCDYSQIELRLVADFAADEVMLDAFAHDRDIHAITASKIYHKDLADVTPTERRNAKTANFGILYGISAFGLSTRLGIPRAEAKMLIDGYFANFPAVHRYMQESIDHARQTGYVLTKMGRRRLLPDINSRNPVVRGYAERNAINAPLQGFAADVIKTAMVAIAGEIRARGLRSRMVMQVHDELNFFVHPDELSLMQELVVRLMEDAYHGRVRLTAACGIASNWLDAH